MTTVTLRIQVDKSGASEGIRAVKDDLQGVGTAGQQAGQQASGGINTLRGALDGARAAVATFIAAYAGIQALSGVVRLADEYTTLQSQLRLVTTSTAEFAAAQSGVFAIAQQTGSALGSVNSLYASLARSTADLGLSQNELFTITQAVSQSMAVSGTSAAAASGAITQLGQAFASGVLRGDEFNSVNEAAPRIMDALAASLGVTRGELRAMAEAGELTSDVLSRGLLQQAPRIAAEFGTMGDTVARAFQRLSNSVLQFVGEANQATGVSAAIASGITALANNIDTVARAFGALATVLATVYGARALGGMAALFQGVATSIALSAAPIGTFITGATAATAATSAWAVAGRALFTLLGGWVGILAAAAGGIFYLATAQTEAEETAALAEDAIQKLRSATDATRPSALAAAQAQLTLAESMLSAAEAALQQRLEFDRSAFGGTGWSAAAIQSRRTDVDLFRGSVVSLRAEIARAQGIDPIVSLRDIGVLQDANTIMRAFGISIGGFADEAIGAVPPAVRLIEMTREQARAAEAARRALDLEVAGMRAAREAATEAIPALGRVVAQQLEMQRAFDGVTGSIEVFYDSTQDAAEVAQQWAQYWDGAIDAVSGAFGDFVASGLRSFSDFGDALKRIAQQIISDLVATFVRNRIVIPISMAFGGGSAAAGPLGGLTGGGGVGGVGGLLGSLLGGAGGLLGGSFGTGLLASGSIFSGAGILGGITGSIGAGISSIAGGAVLQGLGLLAGPIGIIASVGALLSNAFSEQETLLRVRSQQFNGDRQARGIEQSALGNIFVRGETLGDGAAVEIAGRIRDFDNIIAGLLNDEQLAAVRERLSNVNDTFRDGAATVESALSSRFSAILSVLDENVQEFVGTTGTLDERVVRLADAMAITSAAATGLISSDFGEVADVLTRFRTGGEGLGDTFTRLVSGMSLVDDALLLLDGAFAGTRLEAATFAGELIELSGGFDQFAARLNGALETLFSEDERNQFIADQSQQALNAALTGLNITGTGIDSIRQQLRDALRDALASGNAELTNQVLTAANALGAFSSAIEALGEDAVAAANATVFGSSGGLTPGPGLGGDAGTGTAPTGSPVATQLEASQSAARSLERHTGLLEQIANNTRPGANDAGEKSARDAADAGRASAATLREIKALVEVAIRAQAQESLKRTTGANKRTSAA